MVKDLFVFAAALLVMGCSSDQLLRLAPPGILKYEELASEKPPNPVIEEEIAQRKEDGEKTHFPNLSAAPSRSDLPAERSQGELKAEMNALATARDTLAGEVTQDRTAVDEERATAGDIIAAGDQLAEQVGEDETAVSDERAEK
jgi:hypothetical protein